MSPERRNSDRMKGLIRIGYGKTKVCIFDLTDNISPKGLFLRTPYPLDVGTALQIEIQYQIKSKKKYTITLQVKGRVARVQNDHEQQGMGIEFIDLTDEHKAQIKELMKQLPAPSAS